MLEKWLDVRAPSILPLISDLDKRCYTPSGGHTVNLPYTSYPRWRRPDQGTSERRSSSSSSSSSNSSSSCVLTSLVEGSHAGGPYPALSRRIASISSQPLPTCVLLMLFHPSLTLHTKIHQKPGNCASIIYPGSCRIYIISNRTLVLPAPAAIKYPTKEPIGFLYVES